MSAVITQTLVDLERALRAAPRGQRVEIAQSTAQRLDMSLATLYRKLREVTADSKPRKRRSDAGTSALSREDALTISSALMESARRNEKRLYSLEDAVEALRASKMIRADVVDEDTGEIRPLSISAISRALYSFGVHPQQLLQPAPVSELRSRHPNHVWQIDASLCVLYYLKPGADEHGNGLRVMEHDQFYKNKPKNVARIASNRVWSYEITEHASDWIYVKYVMGAESGENLCDVLIDAMQERGGNDILHGVPQILMMDPGSANTSAMARNLCRALRIRVIVHKPGAARVTGQVENARNLIERKFEAGLRFQPVADLDELNAAAKTWRAWFNAAKKHSRHGMTRSEAWMRIREHQLVKAPSVEVCRQLAIAEPESRKVTSKLRVSFQGTEYDVSVVPGVMNGEKLMITRNPWQSDAAQAITFDQDGHEVFHVIPRIEKDNFGFDVRAPMIGEEFRPHAETPAQKARKEAARLAMGVDTDAEEQAARKAKAIPFGGRLKPYQHIEDAQLPTFMPRKGSELQLDVTLPTVESKPLSHPAAAKILRARLDGVWSPESMLWLKSNYPDGVLEDQLDSIVEQLQAASSRPALRVVGGNS
ncbi:TPA: transposase family protein [Pseudomonas aeruginosa]|uniref:DDE-type integrase/transposase/recombinase n=2 Tax=Pseudomonas aeruginosa TaxID=287 RepID=UPI0011B52965|nr:DDE-type integrase/transposase/recombinase [Pseudomonas aeruginosa]TWV91602.1 transposase family protein [Pseudomonas aeruginosa]HBP5182389.1 transposase family protein [Pseudomonas aeruginosa]HCZ8855626.1 DDE-type integrase/transposase/recombinase [Pseudomonas aeruginosa]